MIRQDPEIAQQVHAGSGHRGAPSYQEIIGLEQDGSGAVLPDILQRQLQPAIGAQLESVQAATVPDAYRSGSQQVNRNETVKPKTFHHDSLALLSSRRAKISDEF